MQKKHSKMLQSISKQRHFVKGEAVFTQGHEAHSIYRVISGEIHLFRLDSEGRRTILYRAYDDDFFAEASLNSDHYHCTAYCARDCEIQFINAQGLIKLLHESTAFSMDWIALLSTELRYQRSCVERLHINSASERIIHYLMTEGNRSRELHLQGTLSDFSEVLGLSRETLYRTLRTLEQQGKITRHDQVIRLL